MVVVSPLHGGDVSSTWWYRLLYMVVVSPLHGGDVSSTSIFSMVCFEQFLIITADNEA